MGCYYNLTHGVIIFKFFLSINCKVSHQIYHGKKPSWMNTVLWFLNTNQAKCFRIFGQYSQSKKT